MAPRPSLTSAWQRWNAVGRDAQGLEVFFNREPAALFHLHWHEEWSLGAVLKGRCDFSCAERRYVANPGDVVLIPPFVAHTSETSRRGFAMVMLYLPASLAAQHLGMGDGWPRLATHVWHQPVAARALKQATARRQANVVWKLLAEAVSHCRVGAGFKPALTSKGPAQLMLRRVDPRVAAVCRHLQAESGLTTDLPDLAASAGLSREHFHRLFKRTLGLSPGQYLRQMRIEAAKRLLRNAVALAEVAAECGFADQAHFSRWFRRYLGVSPGCFAAAAQESQLEAIDPSERPPKR